MRKNKGCYWCRKINVDHFASNCPERTETSGKAKVVKQESVSALDVVVESDSDPEYSAHVESVPTIKIVTKIKDVILPESLVDCGATINVISSDKVVEHSMQTHPISPMRIREPMNPHGSTLVSQKVVSKVEIPEEKWQSCRAAEFVVAPLREEDVILGMPFLASEGVLVDPAKGKVILPTQKEEGKELSGEDREDRIIQIGQKEEGDEDGFIWRGQEYWSIPSICPKIAALQKNIPAIPA